MLHMISQHSCKLWTNSSFLPSYSLILTPRGAGTGALNNEAYVQGHREIFPHIKVENTIFNSLVKGKIARSCLYGLPPNARTATNKISCLLVQVSFNL